MSEKIQRYRQSKFSFDTDKCRPYGGKWCKSEDVEKLEVKIEQLKAERDSTLKWIILKLNCPTDNWCERDDRNCCECWMDFIKNEQPKEQGDES